jgi:hypothetical protein
VLLNASLGQVTPEVNAENFGVSKPNTAVMIVIARARVSHTRQRVAAGTGQRIEERPRVLGSEMPSSALGSVDAKRNLVAGKG